MMEAVILRRHRSDCAHYAAAVLQNSTSGSHGVQGPFSSGAGQLHNVLPVLTVTLGHPLGPGGSSVLQMLTATGRQ